ncbi:MAG: TfuA-related McrA-glycine thioamidation protein [Thaumarchaeota archaeon]|nr:MAG: TfuA-related McrA-glycine thioamidation protein [Nitrososphaerota archaeon]
MKEPIVYLGPTLSREEASKILDADYRDPAKKGDFLRLAHASDEKTYVGFIDGVFLHDYPPSPIEVYHLATRKNIELVGASSLGALRAVELEKFGMKGIGKIFQLYKNGIINADDEVAVTFVRGKNILQSEAMIDIRFNLFLAYKKGIISRQTKKRFVKVAKNIYFPFRNYDDIITLTQKSFPSVYDEIENFRNYILKNRDSLKARDAIKLLKYFKNISE